VTTPVSGSSKTAAKQSPATAAIAGGAMGKDQFIKLLVAQMQHQDPLNPTDGQQMATQLAQFSSVEQLMNIGMKLDGQAEGNVALAAAVNNSTAIGLLGKTITVASDEISVGADATSHVDTDVAGSGGRLKLRIVGADGTTLRSEDLGYVAGGPQHVALGRITNGLAAGTYKVAFDVTDAAGKVTNPATTMSVRADGIRYGTNGAVVTAGSRTFPISTVVSVSVTN